VRGSVRAGDATRLRTQVPQIREPQAMCGPEFHPSEVWGISAPVVCDYRSPRSSRDLAKGVRSAAEMEAKFVDRKQSARRSFITRRRRRTSLAGSVSAKPRVVGA
jgi:hypothetical protein